MEAIGMHSEISDDLAYYTCRIHDEHFFLDFKKKEIRINGQYVFLSDNQYEILSYLVLHAGETVSVSAIYDHLYGGGGKADYGVIKVQICHLRKRLGPFKSSLTTVWGRGYKWRVPDSVNDNKHAPALDMRWVIRRKIEIIEQVRKGELTIEQVLKRHGISAPEYRHWEHLFERHGKAGLKVTRFKEYRQLEKDQDVTFC